MLRDLEPLKYPVPDGRYHDLLKTVMAIFDAKQSESVPIETRIAAADALGQTGDPRLDSRRDDYWVTVPAGKFLMGAQKSDPKKPNYDAEAEDEAEWKEKPHEVYLDAYRIARYPVTVGQYNGFVQDEGYQHEIWWKAGGFGEFTAPDDWEGQLAYPSRPVVSVSWYEAAAFCAWAGFRLPTEAEWERAARGKHARKFPWGDATADPSRLNFSGSEIGHATPVGIFPRGATPEGLCDMAGNVWEWCADWFTEYTDKPASNPSGPEKASLRVYRGGSWDFSAGLCRSACRCWDSPALRFNSLGFRLALVPSSKPDRSGRDAEPGAKAEAAKAEPPPHAAAEGEAPDQ